MQFRGHIARIVGVGPEAEARTLVERILTGVAEVAKGSWALEEVDRVYIDGQVGLQVLWLQRQSDGDRRFGLLATLAEVQALADSNGGHFGLSDLHLMFEEPHAGGPIAGARHWFSSTGPFRYAG